MWEMKYYMLGARWQSASPEFIPSRAGKYNCNTLASIAQAPEAGVTHQAEEAWKAEDSVQLLV